MSDADSVSVPINFSTTLFAQLSSADGRKLVKSAPNGMTVWIKPSVTGSNFDLHYRVDTAE